MKLYRIYQDYNDGYDTYDAAIVAAPDAETARRIHPGSGDLCPEDGKWPSLGLGSGTWAPPENVGVVEIGEAAPGQVQGVILASFNAG